MKTLFTRFRTQSMLAAITAVVTFGFASCENEVEKVVEVEKLVEVEKTYAASPTFTAISEEGKVNITMATSTEGATIYYTTDGSEPTSQSTKYEGAISITADTAFTAIAVKAGIANSPAAFALYSVVNKIETKVETQIEYQDGTEFVEKEYAAAVAFETAETYEGVRITMATSTAGAEIHYTTDGTTPTAESTAYAVPLELSASTTVKAIAIKDGIEPSPVFVARVTIKKIAESPSSSGNPLQVDLSAAVPHENKNGVAYTGNKSNTYVTVKAHITTASTVKKVVYKKNGSPIAKTLLADEDATEATVSPDDNSKWTITISATDETANGTYTIAAIDEAGREETEQITIDQFDFTPPAKVTVTSASYESEAAEIILNWTEPSDTDYAKVRITFTSNDGTSDSTASEAVEVAKGTANKTFSGIEGSKAYYTYSLVSVDELGNESAAQTYKVSVNLPEDFVAVTGATVSDAVSDSKVFITDRTVTIGDLYVSDHEVTQAEYEAYCKYGSSSPSDTYGVGDDYPAHFVSWYDAIVYCNLRSIDEGLEPVYQLNGETAPANWTGIVSETTDGMTKYCAPEWSDDWNNITMVGSSDDTVTTANGYRLPTEAEWEYIARGANESTTTYSGSDTADDVAWYSENSGEKMHEVKTKAANGLGIYDMSGNVWEWCWDWWDGFKISDSTTATGSASGNNRVERGGSWNYDAANCAVSYRYYDKPNYRSRRIGFRVVRNAD